MSADLRTSATQTTYPTKAPALTSTWASRTPQATWMACLAHQSKLPQSWTCSNSSSTTTLCTSDSRVCWVLRPHNYSLSTQWWAITWTIPTRVTEVTFWWVRIRWYFPTTTTWFSRCSISKKPSTKTRRMCRATSLVLSGAIVSSAKAPTTSARTTKDWIRPLFPKKISTSLECKGLNRLVRYSSSSILRTLLDNSDWRALLSFWSHPATPSTSPGQCRSTHQTRTITFRCSSRSRTSFATSHWTQLTRTVQRWAKWSAPICSHSRVNKLQTNSQKNWVSPTARALAINEGPTKDQAPTSDY